MIVRAPGYVTHPISERAVEIARRLAPKDTGKGARSLEAIFHPGEVGIRVPEEAYYMMIQNRGFKPFIMWSLEGKTIPMRGASGQISFVRAKDVGKRQITSRDEKGRIVSSKIRWRHPGLAPKNFLERGVDQAIREYMDNMSRSGRLVEILDKSEASVILKEVFKDR